MNFVAKTAFQTKLKRLGEDTGIKDLFSSEDNSVFPSTTTTDDLVTDIEAERNQDEIFPTSLANYFDTRPNNFPPCLHLFYIDRSILQQQAAQTITWAFRLFISIEVLLCLNVITRITVKVLESKEHVVYLILSLAFALLMSIAQLFGYETSFSGAYRTSSKLRLRYLFFCGINFTIIVLYTFLGFAWFNGWSRLSRIPKGNATHHKIQVTLTVIESIAWTVVLFLVMYTGFQYFMMYTNRLQGLSDSARREANAFQNGPPVQSERSRQPALGTRNGGGNQYASDARIQAIKEKYRGQSS